MEDRVLMYEALCIALGAGNLVMRHYGKAQISIKDDNTPVTQADMESHNYICRQLAEVSGIRVCSEEGIIPYDVRKNLRSFWLVDPLDGTKDFIKNSHGFSICIALLRDNEPVVGAVFAPAAKILCGAWKGGGAYIWEGSELEPTMQWLEHKQCRLSGERQSKTQKLVATVSQFHNTKATQTFLDNYNLDSLVCGSALKICYLAAGLADVYPRFNGTKEWDTAAADIILRETGGVCLDIYSKRPLVYNTNTMENPHFIAFSKTQVGAEIYNDVLQGKMVDY